MESRRRFLTAAGAAAASVVFAPTAVPQEAWPGRPLRMVVPWPLGQATDLAARVVAAELAQVVGQPVVIDNRPGSSGTLGTEFVARSPPDGLTLLAASSGPISFTPLLSRTSYDVERDLLPVALMGRSPFVMVTSVSFPPRDLRGFVALVRANPGRYIFGSSGMAATGHLFAEAFNAAAGLRAVHMPYKGSGSVLTALVHGQVDYCFETAAATMPMVRGGHLKALGVSLARGSTVTPGVPSIAAAAGLPGFDLGTWIGVMVAAGTPPAVVQRLGAALEQAMKAPGVGPAFTAIAVELDYRPAEAMRPYLKSISAHFREVIRQADIRLR